MHLTCTLFCCYGEYCRNSSSSERPSLWLYRQNSSRLASRRIYSRQYLPRKGTETFFCGHDDSPNIFKFPTIFTPQGDGNLLLVSHWYSSPFQIPDNIYPARGRKHSLLLSINSADIRVFPTIFTPQGDGNKLRSFQVQCFSRTSGEFPTIFTPQGDGNNNLKVSYFFAGIEIPDNIYPARGRKLVY